MKQKSSKIETLMTGQRELNELCPPRQPGNRNSLLLVLEFLRAGVEATSINQSRHFTNVSTLRQKFLVVTANSSPSAFHPSRKKKKKSSEFLNIKKMKNSSEGKQVISKQKEILSQEKRTKKRSFVGVMP